MDHFNNTILETQLLVHKAKWQLEHMLDNNRKLQENNKILLDTLDRLIIAEKEKLEND